MKFEKEFIVRHSRAQIARALDDDETIQALFPNSTILSKTDGKREIETRYEVFGAENVSKFIFNALPGSGGTRFEKVCDGRVWKSLEGSVRLTPVGDSTTRVQIALEGATRPMVPEFAIKGPMRTQIDQLTQALRTRLEAL